ncbi:MAG TPA: SusC/RagA family TonB-linked outer membrane protein [Gemmatimonas sp.]|uniref:SusC/RagA family TonB-linked outer membrane protein n=1 Tax=Gemmatimonas sp. TaxID=1962908 RepID=UPI002ED93169
MRLFVPAAFTRGERGCSPPVATTPRARAWRRVASTLLTAVAAVGFLAPPTASAQGAGGTITGRVTDGATGQPIQQARILVAGTQVGTLTAENGRYSLRVANTGAVTLEVSRIGYEAKRVTVTVTEGTPVVSDVALTQAAFSLSAVVTTVTGATRKVELANSTSQIAMADKVAELPASSLGQMLSGRSAGVQVVSEGSSGGGSRIRIRGQSSLSLSNNPVVIIDGVRVNAATNSSANGIGGGGPSRFDDINPEEIENIEIIKGPSAATLYGTEAANGVISITTKKGKSGKTKFNFYSENGSITDPRKGSYPELYALWGHNPTGAANNRICTLSNVAAGACVADSLNRGNVLNIDSLTPIDRGNRQQYGMQLSGGNDRVQFFVSGETEIEQGVYKMPDREVARLKAERQISDISSLQLRPNALSRNSMRANLSTQLASNWFLQVSSAYVNSDVRLPQNNDNSQGLMVNAMGAQWREDLLDANRFPLRGYRLWGVGDVFSITNSQYINRFINSVSTQYNPYSWLTTRAAVGLDYTARWDREYNRLNEGPSEGQVRLGQASQHRTAIQQQTIDIGGTGTFQLTPWLNSKTSVGMQFIRGLDQRTGASGLGLPPGSISVTATSLNRTPQEETNDKRTLGYYVEQVFSLSEKLFITGGARRDAASAFGKDFQAVWYPKLGASWVVSEHEFFHKPDWIQSLRLRGTYGASGQIPNPEHPIRYFDANNVTLPNGSDGSGISLTALGNQGLKPEFSAEIETGFDLAMFNGRTNFDVTYYRKNTTDALISREVAPSLAGIPTRLENIGDVRNSGLEITFNHRLFDRDNFAADIAINGSTNKNEMTAIAQGTSAVFTGNRQTQRNQPGYPLFGLWGRKYTYADANNDGMIVIGEVTMDDSSSFVGATYPTREVAISPTIELFGRKLRITGQVDSKWGHKKFNNTLRHQCQNGVSCRGAYDKDASFEEQAKAVTIASATKQSFVGFFEDGAFTRFRELAVTYEMPSKWARSLKAERWTVTFTGRNLGVWTDYSGIDPEASASSNDERGGEEYFATAPLRYFTLRMNFNF